MRERQSLLQRSHLCSVSGRSELPLCFLVARLPVAACVCFFSPALRCLVGLHACFEARKGCSSLTDSLIDLRGQGGVVGDGGAKVCERMDDIELIIMDGDGWWRFGAFSHDVDLFQADGQPEVSAGPGEVVHQ